MSRRSLAGAIAFVALLALTIGTAAVLLLRHEPGHHRTAEVPPGAQRTNQSQQCFGELIAIYNVAKSDDRWSQSFTFTDEQINSYLGEGFVQQGWAEKLLPEGISEPRVAFDQDVMRLSFRYRTRLISTVVSVDLRAWVAADEANVLALCIDGFHAGAMPFKAQWLLERISEVARQNEVEVNWYRHEGKPVAILRFQANQARPTLRLNEVRIEKGQLTVHGESSDQARTAMNLVPGEPDRP